MSDIASLYNKTLTETNSVMAKVLSEKKAELAQCHSRLADIVQLYRIIENRTESPIYASAVHDMQMAMFIVSIGAYRQAYGTLRKSIETVVSGCYFSGNLCELKMWEKGKKDIRWTEMLEGENGIFGDRFIEAFSEGIGAEAIAYKEMARNIYRDLSGYVHNESRTTYSDGITFSYSDKEVDGFISKFYEVSDVVLFVLCMRYLEEFTSVELGSIEHVVNDRLGSVARFQSIIGGQTGG